MPSVERVTVTLPVELVSNMDRRRKNRRNFIAEPDLRRPLDNPHPESARSRGLPAEDTEALLDKNAGKPVLWIPGEGWVEGRE